MMKITKSDVLFSVGVITALWFALFGVIWGYLAALFIAYPAGIISLIIWLVIKKENKKRTKFIPIILSIGLALSLGVLIFLLLYN